MLQLLKSVLQKFSGCERGSTMLELAVSVPVLVSLSAGIFEFGNLIQKKLLIEAGLRDAARYCARCNTSLTGLNCSTASQNIAVTGTHDGSGDADTKAASRREADTGGGSRERRLDLAGEGGAVGGGGGELD